METFYIIKLYVQVTDSYKKDLHVKDHDILKLNIIKAVA